MKFISFLNESINHYNNEYDYETEADNALRLYIKDPNKRYLLRKYENQLMNMYGNNEPLKLYRGLNFNTIEDYNEFIDNISNGEITIDNECSSWTRSYQTAMQFAKTKPSYMEFMTLEKIRLIDDAEKNNEYVVGFRGVILEIDIEKDVGIDTAMTDYNAEDEVILFRGTYKCKYHDILKNSDRINSEGIQKILDEIEEQRNDDNYNKIMISKIIKDHRAEFTPKIKSFFGKRFLKSQLGFRFYYNKDSIINENTIVVFLQRLPILKYGTEVFNKEDLDKFYKENYMDHKKKLFDLKKLIKEHEDATIIWDADNPGEWFKSIGLDNEFNSLFTHFGKKYNDLNSKKNIDNINKLNGDDKKKAIKDFASSIKDIIKSI